MRSWWNRLQSRAQANQAIPDPHLDRWALSLGLGFLVLGLACRLLRYLLAYPIWIDESWIALNFLDRDYRGLLCELDYFQVAPLLFLWAQKTVWLWFGPSEQWLRLLPLCAGLVALVVFWRLARLCLEPLPAALAVGLLAVARSPVILGAMIKPYSADLLLASLYLLLAVHHLREPGARRYLVLLTLLTPWAVCASYPLVFVAGAVGLVLFPTAWREGGWGQRGWFAAFGLLLMGTFIAHLRLVGTEVYDPGVRPVKEFMANFWHEGFPPAHPGRLLHWLLRRHVGHSFSYPVEWNGGGLVGFILVVSGAAALWQKRQRAVVLLCVLPLALHLVAGILRRFPYAVYQRIEQDLAPGICLLIAVGVVAWIQALAPGVAARRRWVLGSCGVLLLVAVGGAVRDVACPYHDGAANWAGRIAGYLRGEVRAQDQVVVRDSARHVYACLRWNLESLGCQVRYDDSVDWTTLERSGGRLWLVHAREELIDPGDPLPAPEDALSGVRQGAWRAVHQERFLHFAPASKPRLFRYRCDVHRLEPGRPPGGVVRGMAR